MLISFFTGAIFPILFEYLQVKSYKMATNGGQSWLAYCNQLNILLQ